MPSVHWRNPGLLGDVLNAFNDRLENESIPAALQVPWLAPRGQHRVAWLSFFREVRDRHRLRTEDDPQRQKAFCELVEDGNGEAPATFKKHSQEVLTDIQNLKFLLKDDDVAAADAVAKALGSRAPPVAEASAAAAAAAKQDALEEEENELIQHRK